MSRPPASMPRLGVGSSPGDAFAAADLEPALASALAAGCRLVDTAEVYGSEPVLGRLLAAGRCERRDLFLVSKLWQTNHASDHVIEACHGSLARLGVDELDLYLVHHPDAWRYCGPLEVAPGWSREEISARVVPRDSEGRIERAEVPIEETWAAMLELKRRGLARAVGVANFEVRQLEALAAAGLEPPAVVQVELHPLAPREELRRYCAAAGIRVMAHSPLAGGRLVRDAVVSELARELARSPAQVVLGWHLARGVVPVPGSHDPAHLRDDLAALELRLPAEALSALDRLGSDD